MGEWVVIIYDKPGADRTPYIDEHFGNIPNVVKLGFLVCGGAIYKDTNETNGELVAIGSHLQVVADNKDQIINNLKHDIFAKEGIWDFDNIIIHPFGCAVRQPLA